MKTLDRKVNGDGLSRKIMNHKKIAFCKKTGEMIGVGSLVKIQA
jgi:hypothetical protein